MSMSSSQFGDPATHPGASPAAPPAPGAGRHRPLILRNLMHRPGRSRLLLELDLTRPIVEVEPPDLPGKLRARSALRWRRLVAAVDDGARDGGVAGLVATVGSRITLSHAQELRAAVERFAATGKPAYVW